MKSIKIFDPAVDRLALAVLLSPPPQAFRMSCCTRFVMAAALSSLVATAHAGPITGQGSWETDLHARDLDGNAVALGDARAAFFWDARTDLTWLADMGAGGYGDWDSATGWAAALTAGGFTDWRLPTIIDSGAAGCNFSTAGGTDCGYNVQTQVDGAYSEWADLYHTTLGNKAYCSPGDTACEDEQAGYGLTNTAYFQNMASYTYWSGTPYQSDAVWYFNTADGRQGLTDKGFGGYATAVRHGDVLREDGTVPEPHSLALALVALTGLGVSLRRRRAADASARRSL